MRHGEPPDADVDAHNTLLHNKHGRSSHAIATQLASALRRHVSPFRLLVTALSVFFLFLVFRHDSTASLDHSASVAFPLPVACCPHTSYHPRLQIVAVGDSITEYGGRHGGWVSLLSAHYARHADVYNRGYGGYNTRTYLQLLHQHLRLGLWPYQPSQLEEDSSAVVEGAAWRRLVTLYLGTNDAALPDSATNESRIHTPLDEFSTNLRSLVAQLVPQYAGHLPPSSTPPTRYLSRHTALILIAPAQVNITHWQTRSLTPPYPPTSSLPVTRSVAQTAHYAAAVQALASEWHIPCLNLFELSGESEWQRLFSDGLHFSEQGNQLVYEGIMRLVRERYGELEVRNDTAGAAEAGKLEWDAPVYWEIDYHNITQSFAVKDAGG